MNPLVLKLQTFFLKNKTLFIKIFKIIEGIIIFLILSGPVLYQFAQKTFFQLSPVLGNEAGEYALYLYCLTLTPGILNRLKVLLPLRVVLMAYRRHLGITMFFLAFLHMSYTTTIPLIMENAFSLKLLTQHQIAGFLALLTLFPLWLTSNDYSMKKLGHFWSTLHRITYVALFFMFMHVALLGTTKMMIISGAFLVLETLSWMMEWRRQGKAKQILRAQQAKPDQPPTQVGNPANQEVVNS